MKKSRLWKILTALSMLIGLSLVSNAPKVVKAADEDIVLTSTNLGLNTTSYAANNKSHTVGSNSYTTYQVMLSSARMQFQANNGYIFNDIAFESDIDSISVDGVSLSLYVADTVRTGGSTSGATSITSTGTAPYVFSLGDINAKYFLLKKASSGAGYANSITITFKGETDAVSISIALADANLPNVQVGNTTELEPTITNADDSSLTWHSDNTSVATVNDGVVTGVSVGKAKIHAEINVEGTDYVSNEIEITVEQDYAANPIDVSAVDLTEINVGYLGLSGSSYSPNDGNHVHTVDGGTYWTTDVAVTNGIQFKASTGVLYNRNPYSRDIASIELDFDSNTNKGAPVVTVGDNENPTGTAITAETVGNLFVYRPAAGARYFKVAAGASLTQVQRIKIYFVDRYIVEFDADGGELEEGAVEIDIVSSGDSVTLPSATRYGYDFVCWIDDVEMDPHDIEDSYEVESDVLFLADWEAVTPTKLTTPTIASMPDYDNSFVITWNAVENAVKYAIKIEGATITTINEDTTGTSRNLVSLGEGEFTFTITAIGNGVYYSDSDAKVVSLDLVIPVEAKIGDLATRASLGFGYKTIVTPISSIAKWQFASTHSTDGMDSSVSSKVYSEKGDTSGLYLDGQNAYYGYQSGRSGMKMGSGSNKGILSYTIPSSMVDASGLSLDLLKYGSDSGKVLVKINDVVMQTITLTDSWTTYTFDVEVGSKISIEGNAASNNRFWVSDFEILGGGNDFTFEDYKLRFGCEIPAAVYEDANAVSVGVEITKAGSDDVLDIPMTTDQVEKVGENYTFNAVLNKIPDTLDGLTSELTARCYVVIGTEKVYTSEKVISVKDVVDAYITNAASLEISADDVVVLKALQKHIASL